MKIKEVEERSFFESYNCATQTNTKQKLEAAHTTHKNEYVYISND